MTDLDDLELDGDDDGDEHAGHELGDTDDALEHPGGPSELEASDPGELTPDLTPDRPLIPPFAPALLLLVAVPLGLYLLLRPAAPPEPASEAETAPASTAPAPAASPEPSAAPEPAVDLPPLEQSDAAVRALLAAVSPHPDLASWLGRDQLVRTFVAVVVNVADGENPTVHLDFLAPKEKFRTRDAGPGPVLDPAGYRRFDAPAAVVASVDAGQAARAYRALTPLFEQAYAELGHPEGGFDAAFARAVDKLLSVPVQRGEIALRRVSANYAFADPALEGLEPAQKLLLRAGPNNQQAIQRFLRQLAERLRPAAEAPAGR